MCEGAGSWNYRQCELPYVKLKIKIKSLKRKKCSPGNNKMIQSLCFLLSLTI